MSNSEIIKLLELSKTEIEYYRSLMTISQRVKTTGYTLGKLDRAIKKLTSDLRH